jgi:hypothetical protein
MQYDALTARVMVRRIRYENITGLKASISKGIGNKSAMFAVGRDRNDGPAIFCDGPIL